MKVLHEEIKEKVIAHFQALKGVKCDVCGRFVAPKWGRSKENKYYNVTTGHNDWGNDSFESRESRDICPDCINAFVTKYLDESKGSQYIEIDPEYCNPEDVRV
jgi:hypothetical protein